MKTIRTFSLPEENVNSKDSAHPQKTTREAARAILINNVGQIALLHVSHHGYFKLPGGGIEGSESKEEALLREIHEETGCGVSIDRELGIIIEENSSWKQISYCFVTHVDTYGESDYTQSEIDAGFMLKWLTPEEATSAIKAILKKVNETIDRGEDQENPHLLSTKRISERDLVILEEYLQ